MSDDEQRTPLTQNWFDRLISITPDDVDLDAAVAHAAAWARAKGLFAVLQKSDDITERDTDPNERVAAQSTPSIDRALWYDSEDIPLAEETLERLHELVPEENDFVRAVIYAVAKAQQEDEFEALRQTYGFREEIMEFVRDKGDMLDDKVQEHNTEFAERLEQAAQSHEEGHS